MTQAINVTALTEEEHNGPESSKDYVVEARYRVNASDPFTAIVKMANGEVAPYEWTIIEVNELKLRLENQQ